MPYQLGQYVNAHNARQRRTPSARALAAAAAGAYGALPSFPRWPTTPTVAQVVRATHELKNLDSATGGTLATTNAGTFFLINGCTQGTGAINRTGRRTQQASHRLSYSFFTATGLLGPDNVRIIVFTDTESRGAAPLSSDLLQNNTFGNTQINSSLQADNLKRFKVHYDQVHSLVPSINTAATTTLQAVVHAVVHPKINRDVHYYNTSSGTITDLDSGALWVFVCGSVNTASSVTFDSRVMYRDI